MFLTHLTKASHSGVLDFQPEKSFGQKKIRKFFRPKIFVVNVLNVQNMSLHEIVNIKKLYLMVKTSCNVDM